MSTKPLRKLVDAYEYKLSTMDPDTDLDQIEYLQNAVCNLRMRIYRIERTERLIGESII